MEYNKSYEREDFEQYQEYLSSIKDRLPKDVFDFLADPSRHDFSERSLHDSLLEKVEYIRFLDTGKLTVSLVFINADFNRRFYFYFQNVSQYKISQQASDMSSDLITYEVGLGQDADENEKIVFRAMFSGENVLVEIYFDQMSIEEKMVE